MSIHKLCHTAIAELEAENERLREVLRDAEKVVRSFEAGDEWDRLKAENERLRQEREKWAQMQQREMERAAKAKRQLKRALVALKAMICHPLRERDNAVTVIRAEWPNWLTEDRP